MNFVIVTIIIVGLTAIFGVSAIWGLVWAIRTGQLRQFNAGARSIFDEDEPEGRVTDAFPGQEPPSSPELPRQRKDQARR